MRPPESATDTDSATYHAPRHAAARTDDYVFAQLIPYLGNKRKLLPLIAEAVARTGVTGGMFADLFAGSGVVARWAKRQGFRVVANDWEPYAHALSACAIGLNAPPAAAVGLRRAERPAALPRRLPGPPLLPRRRRPPRPAARALLLDPRQRAQTRRPAPADRRLGGGRPT